MTTLLALLLLPLSAHAYPSVGDKVTFGISVSQGGASQTGTLSHELTSYDAGRKAWLQLSTVVLGGGAPDVNQQWLKQSDLQDPQKISTVLTACAMAGGTRQTIQVPAGAFDTCHITSTNGTDSGQYWIGLVPFGVVRFVTVHAGRTSTGELASFRAP